MYINVNKYKCMFKLQHLLYTLIYIYIYIYLHKYTLLYIFHFHWGVTNFTHSQSYRYEILAELLYFFFKFLMNSQQTGSIIVLNCNYGSNKSKYNIC